MIVRCPVRMRITSLALAAGFLAAGCDDDGDAEAPAEIEPAVVFALDRAAQADALVPMLIEQQRALYAAIRGHDSDRMSELLQTDFHWNPGYARTAGIPTPAGADYLAMLAGYRPSSLADMPTAYDVNLITDGLVWVYAGRADDGGGIVTGWERRGDEWRARWARDVSTDLAAWQENRRRAEAERRERR